ncbi:MAG: anti-sigma factor antagonist [Candidatus Aminicenantes bacterium]|nr:anti-sigma factor antagonist [Candidatus Aminicenantes bacterium]
MEIDLREKQNITILDIEGEIRRSESSDSTLHQVVKDQLEKNKKYFLLNLDKVEFIDSFGVGEILASYISTQNVGGSLKLTNISKKLFLVFQVTMLSKVFEIFNDEQKALESFSKE